jgi:hypothetical protein
MADNEIFITVGNANNTIGITGDNSQYFSEEAKKSAVQAKQSATEAKGYAEQAKTTKNELLTNSDFVAVRNSLDEITILSENLDTIETSGNNIEAIKTVSKNISNVNTTANNLSTIQTTVSNLTTMNTVVSNLTPIKNTANNITAIKNVNTNIEAVKSNYTNISDIKTNATNMADIKNTAKLVTTLDEKVDIDDMVQVDFADAGSYISGCAMPSSKYDDLALGASGTTYTAPANGWFYCHGVATSPYSSYGTLDTALMSQGVDIARSTGSFKLSMPVRKGDVVTLRYGECTLDLVRFIYAEGEV